MNIVVLYSLAGQEVSREIEAAGRPQRQEGFGVDPDAVWGMTDEELEAAPAFWEKRSKATRLWRRKERRHLRWMEAKARQRKAMANGMIVTWR